MVAIQRATSSGYFPSTTAWAYSTSALNGKRIRPNDEISYYRGSWALTEELERQEHQRREAAEFRSQLAAFIKRMG